MKLVFLLKLTFAIAVTSPNYQSTTSLNSITDEPQNSYKLRNVTKVQLETRKSLKGPPQDKKIDSDKHGKEKLPGSQECQGQLYEDKAGINESLENLLPLARQNTDISIIQENFTNASNINDKEMLVKRQENSRYAKSIYTLQRSSSGQLFSGEEGKKFVSEINVSTRSTNKQYISTYGSVLVAPTNSPKIGTVNDGNYSEHNVLNKENTSFTETWKRSQKNLKPLYSLSKLLKRQTHLQYAEVSDNSYTSLLRKIHETNNISSTKNTKLLKVERFLSPSSSMINVQTQLRPQTEQEKSKNPENFTTHLLPPAFVTKEGNISPESFSTNVNQSSDVYLGRVKVGGTENKRNKTLGENSQDLVVNVPRKTKLGQRTIAEQIVQLDAHKKYDIPDRKNDPHLLHNTRYYSDIIPERGSQGKQNNVTLLEVYDYKQDDAKENSTFYKIMPFSTEKAFNRNPESIHTSVKGTTKFLSQAISTTMPSARNLNLINDPTTKYILLRGTDPSHRNIKSIIEHPQKHLLSEDNIHPTINENKAHQKRELLPKVIKANVVKRTSLKEGTGRIASENLSQDNEGDNAVLPENEMLRDYRTSSSTQDVSGENPWNFQITTPIAQTSATADNPSIALAITDEVFKQENTFRTTTQSVSDDSETALSPQTAIGGDSGLETTTSLQLTGENSQTTTELLDHISLRSLLSGDLTTPFSLHKSGNLMPQSPDVATRTSINSNDFGILKYRNETSRKMASPIADLKARLDPRSRNKSSDTFTALAPPRGLESYPDLYGTFFTQEIIYPGDNASSALNLSASGGKVMPEMPWPVKKEAVVEGDLVLGGLMMVHEREDTVTCGPVMPQGGIQALEAMLYTLDRVNFGPEILLPNITIGAHILDDCDKDTYGLEMAVDFIKGSISNIDGAEYHCNKTQVRKVISGVVGAASSVTSIQVANLLRLFKIPQVSFFSTSPELSNKQRFEYFTRTIPSDHYQVKAMVDIVRLLGWSYISIIYEESNYGIKAFEELEDLLAEHNICIAVKEKLVKDSGVAGESAYDNIVQKLLTKPRARGCIIFGSDQEVAELMKAVRRSNATGAFSWIGSDGWSARSLVSHGNEAEVEGTLSVQPQANPVRGFKDYFLSLNVENNPRNPWFIEFWEHHFGCKYPNSSKTPYNTKYSKMCIGTEKLTEENTVFEDQLQFVSDAVLAFAYAIRDMHRDLCKGQPGLCEAMKPTKGTELLKYLRKVDFEGLTGDRFHFDINGDGPARYNIIHFKQVSPGIFQWIRVGEYLEGELSLNMSEIQFKLGHPKPPESVCSLPCDLGQAKKYVEGESCCWHCFNCTQYQIRHPTDPTQCVVCPQGTVPDHHHVRCKDIPEEYLQPDSGWAIGAMALSSTGVLITMFVCGVFIRHNDTPVVRASGRELSYVLLAGILMCYSVTYALVLRPNDTVCGIQRFGAGFCFTVVYAALLTKTNRISRIFNAGKHSAKRPSFISPRSQLIICSGLVGVQVLINGVWMVISPARAIHHYPTREDNLLVCSSYIDASYMIAFTYPIFLIVVCTVYAVLTRKIPEAFNESKHIGFTMYTTCVIWLAFVPLYFGTANHVALRITSMSVTISLSASVTVACLFSPKLYIILIRPERNVRQSMMPMRYSAITKTTTNTGSNSMMAAVMVTAATCDQKQQIQKHVPPIQNDDETDTSDSKIKRDTKDNTTQTSPYSSNNMLNSSQEHLPKYNNNCNVGNGPLALLPGTQIKDFSL